jgi:hypothetical protein
MRLLERISDTLIIVCLFLTLTTSNVAAPNLRKRVSMLAEDHRFDFSSWTRSALWVKLTQSAIGSPRYFLPEAQHGVVVEYFKVVDEIQRAEVDIARIYTDPAIKDPANVSASLRQRLEALTRRQNNIAPLAEATLEQQVTSVLNNLGLLNGGQAIPWVLYHVTPLPNNLIISPRDKILQEASYQLEPDLTTEQATRLEDRVSQELDVSSLVVEIGGLATYPTMIMRGTSLDWLSNTIVHEWIHLYLEQRPLGRNYSTSGELRTMNETTASIVGNEIGRMVLERYYPERLTVAPQLVSHALNENPPFDFRAEMHTTRVKVDELLAAGKIDEAESYMEQRRQVFWDNGYAIRKLNQAYFAFHGAYADTPGGAAGEDPVGPAVRALRAQSATLTDFLERISQMSSYGELQKAIGAGTGAQSGY